ncbi:hypothetical protein KUCAC02_025718 [Chaenocephalus aceratus]|uniref:Uncharacterized protein n=1 Tax=Chaenocephalus aceratus TaxID=36190 RepID=A0ACB9VVD6_CHAAC|nr:hypothetical protein KUCAC02_025718 [Chaenocephalus aceratus]
MDPWLRTSRPPLSRPELPEELYKSVLAIYNILTLRMWADLDPAAQNEAREVAVCGKLITRSRSASSLRITLRVRNRIVPSVPLGLDTAHIKPSNTLGFHSQE